MAVVGGAPRAHPVGRCESRSTSRNARAFSTSYASSSAGPGIQPDFRVRPGRSRRSAPARQLGGARARRGCGARRRSRQRGRVSRLADRDRPSGGSSLPVEPRSHRANFLRQAIRATAAANAEVVEGRGGAFTSRTSSTWSSRAACASRTSPPSPPERSRPADACSPCQSSCKRAGARRLRDLPAPRVSASGRLHPRLDRARSDLKLTSRGVVSRETLPRRFPVLSRRAGGVVEWRGRSRSSIRRVESARRRPRST